MSRPVQLESFEQASGRLSLDDDAVSREEAEAARLEGYDAGYQSGWDDAMAQVAADQTKISEEFARNLRDLGFTYHEARAHVIASMEPLVEALISALFPQFAADAIAAQVMSIVQGHADRLGSQPIRLRVSPDDVEALRAMPALSDSFPMEITEEPALATGQAQLVLGKSEYRIDLADVIDATRAALTALHDTNERNLKRA